MAILLLSLVALLSSVDGRYRQPFTAFHPAQFERVHANGPLHGTIKNLPLNQRLYSNQGYQKPTTYQGFQTSSGLIQRQYTNFPQRNAAILSSASGNIVEKTKAQTDYAISLLKSLENNKQATEYIDNVLETSACLNSVQDAIELLEEFNNLIRENAPEIIYLEAIVDNLENEKDINKLLKSSAKILRTLEGLVPNLSKKSSKLCISSPEDSFEAFKSLAHAFEDLLNHRDINLPYSSRQQLELSSKILRQTASFIASLNKSISSFQELCKNDKKNNAAVYTSIEDILESLAGLFEVLGFEDKSKDIKKQEEFVKKIVGVFDDLYELDTFINCGLDGSYGELALTLQDLAEIVESVGIEKLSKELGIDLDFVNNL